MTPNLNKSESDRLVFRAAIQWALTALLLLAVLAAAISVRSNLRDMDVSRNLKLQEDTVALEANSIRYRLEAQTLSYFYLVTSLGTYISTNPDLSQEEYRRFVRVIIDAKEGLVNVAAAPDLVIRYVYPLEGNEAALGLDYRANPKQKEAALAVMEKGEPVIAGPLELVQGGTAIIGRFPVYTESGFWGIVSTPVYLNSLLRDAGLLDESLSIELALRGKDGKGADGELFFGDGALFEGRSLRLPVRLFSGSWELAASPVGGWIREPKDALLIDLIVWALAGLVGAVIVLLNVYVFRLVKERELEASVSKAKSRFLATLSHEIRTPLNGITGSAQLLRMSDLSEEDDDLAATICSSAEALTGLMTDLLDLSRFDAAGVVIHRSRIVLSECLEPILGALYAQAEEKSIEFRFDGVAPDCEELDIDLLVLRQTLWNLLSNAVKFTREGYVSLKIEKLAGSANAGERLRIRVEDTGVGIEQSRQQAVFDDFVQEDDTTTRVYGGAGLGLAIVRRLVQAAQGTIELESEKGKGSLFVVEIPLGL